MGLRKWFPVPVWWSRVSHPQKVLKLRGKIRIFMQFQVTIVYIDFYSYHFIGLLTVVFLVAPRAKNGGLGLTGSDVCDRVHQRRRLSPRGTDNEFQQYNHRSLRHIAVHWKCSSLADKKNVKQ
jgi:hypothetical protein